MYGISVDDLIKSPMEMNSQEFCGKETEMGQGSEGERNRDDMKTIENLLIVMVVIITCILPCIGLVLNISIILYCKRKHKKFEDFWKVIIMICLIVNIVNSLMYINCEYLHMGRVTIEKIAFVKSL